MNLILHQFKTDVRHFRWWLTVTWLAFAADAARMCANSLSAYGQEIWQLVILIWQIFNAVFLIAALIQADSLVGTSAAWLTRPVRRRHLFWAKSAFIVLLLVLPKIASQSIDWMERGYSFHLWLCAAGQSLMFCAVVVLVTAVLASLTRDLARFFLAVGIAAAGMFAWAVVEEMLHRAGLIDKGGAERYALASFDASVLTAAHLALIAGALLAWIAQAGMRKQRAGIIFLAAGLMAAPLLGTVWRINFLKPRLTSAAPLKMLLTDNWPTNLPSGQQLAMEIAVDGLPPRDVAVVQDVHTSIRFDGEKKGRDFFQQDLYRGFNRRLLPAESYQKDNYVRVIQGFFPKETLWFNERFGLWSAFGQEYNDFVKKRYDDHPPPGLLNLRLELDLFAVKKVAEVPLRRMTFNTLPGQWETIENVRIAGGVITVSINESCADLMWDDNANSAGFTMVDYMRQPYCAYVLYDETSGEAMMVRPENNGFRFMPPLDATSHFEFKLRFPCPELRKRLLGVSAADWLRQARLWVFAPAYDGTATENIMREHYHWISPESH